MTNEPSLPPQAGDNGSILALTVLPNAAGACLLEWVGSQYRLVGWTGAPLAEDGNLADLGAEVCRRLGERLGRTLWHEREGAPLLFSDDPVGAPPLSQLTMVASPRPPVRVWLAGLSPSQSMAAARSALASGPANLVGVTAYTAALQLGPLTDSLALAAPELVVVAGGFDNPDADTQQPILELCRLLGQALARAAPAQRAGVVFAGNRWAAAQAVELLQPAGGGQVESVENVQPAPGIVHKRALVQALNFYYWRLCRRLPGFKEISRWVTGPGHLTSVETSFVQLTQVWMDVHGLPELHSLYAGPGWWLHVLAARSRAGVDLQYVDPDTRPPALDRWPPLQFVSGAWPQRQWPQPEKWWWDRSGMAPAVAAVGQVTPLAMIQVLGADILEHHDATR